VREQKTKSNGNAVLVLKCYFKKIREIFSCNLSKCCPNLAILAEMLLRHSAIKGWFIF